jgi:tRNA(fMet)-specific endonuclease VapC
VTLYMLDTNIVGHLINQHPAVVRRVLDVSMASLCISAVTKGELVYGLEKRPDATRLHRAVAEFLRRVDVLPWDRKTAARYGGLRAAMQRNGKTVASLDLFIAAHSLEAGAVLVTNDKAFRHVPGLGIEDWTV